MKKTMMLLALIALSYSCEKTRYCWKCDMSILITNQPTQHIISEYCDKSQKEMLDISKEQSTVSTVGSYTMRKVMNCSRKQ